MAANTEVKKKGGIKKWFKDLISELKKVTWPKFKTVVKQTGIVFVVVGFFLAAVWLIDAGLSQAYKALMGILTA